MGRATVIREQAVDEKRVDSNDPGRKETRNDKCKSDRHSFFDGVWILDRNVVE